MNPLPARDLDHILEKTESLWPDARGARFFITGGTGFVGTWLTESLLWANRRLGLGMQAVVLTRDPARRGDARFLIGDVKEFAIPAGDFDFAIHAAAHPYVVPSTEWPGGLLDQEMAATKRVLTLARDCGVRRLLFTSSGAAYGKQPPEIANVSEEYAGGPMPFDTGASYGVAKRVSEYLCSCYSQVYGFEATLARLFAFIGPRLPLDANYAAGNFLRDALAGGPIEIAGDGTPYRSYLYAADLTIWLWTILFRGKSARPYNVGSPEPVSIVDLARTSAREVAPGAEIRVAKQPVEGAPAARYVPSVERAEKELGLRVWIGLEDAIRRTAEWYR
jgi:nucleoside-diphosphate-sugar epimerase